MAPATKGQDNEGSEERSRGTEKGFGVGKAEERV